MDPRPIVITGFMCSGKTTVARALAELLGCVAIDLDDEITARDGNTPAELIKQKGERAFREIETRVLARVLEEGARVIALGGGAWTVAANRQLISHFKGVSIWLDLPFEICWQRIVSAGASRPLAQNERAAEDLYKLRWPLYQKALLRISLNQDQDPHAVAEQVAAELARIGKK